MTVVTGRIERIDRVLGLVSLGVMQVRLSESTWLTGLEPGMSVTITYEERDGELWAMCVKRVRM